MLHCGICGGEDQEQTCCVTLYFVCMVQRTGKNCVGDLERMPCLRQQTHPEIETSICRANGWKLPENAVICKSRRIAGAQSIMRPLFSTSLDEEFVVSKLLRDIAGLECPGRQCRFQQRSPAHGRGSGNQRVCQIECMMI